MPTSPDTPSFDVVMRGYSREHVDRYLETALASLVPPSPPAFPVGMRGYDRRQVDAYIAALIRAGDDR